LGKLLAHAGHERYVQRTIGRSPAAATQVIRFEERDRKHWAIPSATRRRCRVCAENGVTRNVSVICKSCNVAFVAIDDAMWTTTTRQIPETFQAFQPDILT